jgi:hypothetical protein
MIDQVQYRPPDQKVLDRRMKAADKPGDHLWIVTAAWLVPDPRAARDGTPLLDTENIIAFAGVRCFKCERQFSNRVARLPCRGSVDEIQETVND